MKGWNHIAQIIKKVGYGVRYLVVVFCPLLFSGVLHCHAQSERLHFDHIGLEEGISNENVINILRDRKGYLWFGTMGGLNRFDGYTFTQYQFDPYDTTSLSQNLVHTLWEDRDGIIWIGNPEGLCRFDRTTEKFTRYKPDPNSHFSDPNISAINEDKHGTMWVGSYAGGLCRFDRQRGIFLPDKFDLKDVLCISSDRAGNLWIGNSTGLYSLNLTATKTGKPSTPVFTHYQHVAGNPNSLSSNRISTIFEDSRDILWMATSNGLNSYDRKTGLFTRYQNDPNNKHSISSNDIFWGSIAEDRKGNLWIGTQNGLNKLNAGRTGFTSYLHDPNDKFSLGDNYVTSLHIDSADVLYAGTWGGKLNKANLHPKSFGLIQSDPKQPDQLSNNKVTSILEDSSGIVWIGTYGGGLNRWDKKSNKFKHFRSVPNKFKTLRSDSILALLEDRHGHLWVCNGDVLSQLNKKTGEFSHHYTNTARHNDERSKFIISIAEDRDGFLWLGTGDGLKRFNEKDGKLQHHRYNPADSNGISDYTAITVYADSRDNIWIGYGSRGTDRFDKRTGRFIHYKHNPKDPASISSNVVKIFYEDAKGNLWLGTMAGGLCRFDYQTGKFKTFTVKHGLPDNTVYSILSDSKGQLWLGTDKGLSRFDPEEETFTNYDSKDGLQSNKFAAGGMGDLDRGANWKGRDGTLYFGGINGFNYFDPLQVRSNNHLAPLVITQFKLFDKVVKGAHEWKEIVLKHNQNFFSFEFSSLSYHLPSKNQYKYILEGVDKDWVYSGSRRYVSYTNIDPGKYTFRAKGTNNDGIWNEEGAYITVIVKPPWWRTWWAYILYVLAFAGLIYAFIQYRINKIRMQHEMVVQKHKATELEMQALRAQMNPHFIFNSLNSINRFILQNNKTLASGYLIKFSKLVRMILQNSQASFITLESELEALALYLDLEALRFEQHFEYKISVPDDLDVEVLKVPPLIIQPYVENAIWHGLMHKEEKGHINIEISQDENQLVFKITDDGIGRKQAAILANKKNTKHKSIGLKITEERIAMLQRLNGTESSVTIIDLVTADNSAAGTEAIIKIPVLYENV